MTERSLSPDLLRDRVQRWTVQRDDESCWDWVGFTHPQGYGHLTIAGMLFKAHRAAYEAYNGPIPHEMHVLHRCDNPGCVNPDHLFLGTHTDNMQDKASKNRSAVMAGEDNPHSKLSTWMVADIIRRRRNGEPGVNVAQLYGVSPCTVSAINVGRNWSHVSLEDSK